MKIKSFKCTFMQTKKNTFYFTGLFFVNILVQYISFSGYAATDDKSYMLVARTIIEGLHDWELVAYSIRVSEGLVSFDFGALRYAYTLPLTFFSWLFSFDISYLFFFNVLVSFFLAASVYLYTNYLTDNGIVSLISSSLVTLLPLNVVFSGFVGVDLIQCAYLIISFYFFDKSVRLFHLQNSGYYSVIAGVFFGLAYSAKLSSIIFAVPLLLYYLMVFKKDILSYRVVKLGLSSILGFISIFFIEALVNLYFFGEVISRLAIISSDDVAELYKWRMGQHGIALFERLIYFNNIISKSMGWSFWLLFTLSFISIFINRKHLLLWLCAFWSFFYLTFGSTSFSEYLPPPIKIRYYILPITLFSICSLILIFELTKFIKNRLYDLGLVMSPSYFVGALNVFSLLLVFFIYSESYRFIETQSGNLYRSLFYKSYLHIRDDLNHELGLDERTVIYDDYYFRWFEVIENRDIPHIPNDSIAKEKIYNLIENGFYIWSPIDGASKKTIREKIVQQLSYYDDLDNKFDIQIVEYHCPLPSYMIISNIFRHRALKNSYYQENEGRCDKGGLLYYIHAGVESNKNEILDTYKDNVFMVHNRRPEYVDIYQKRNKYSLVIQGDKLAQDYALFSFVEKLNRSLSYIIPLFEVSNRNDKIKVSFKVNNNLALSTPYLEVYAYFYSDEKLVTRKLVNAFDLQREGNISNVIEIPEGSNKINLGFVVKHNNAKVSISIQDVKISILSENL